MIKKFSKETVKLAELCWKDTEVRATKVFVGQNYFDDKGTKYKITEDVYRELIDYQNETDKKFRMIREGNILLLMGIN